MPLPQPKPNELREDFVDRCVANIDMILEFPEADQRMAICYNLYEASRKAQATAAPKINKAEYIREANRQLKLAETEQYLKFYNYFKREYFKGADRFLQTRSLPETVDLFKESDIAKLYEDLYVEVGLRFLRWYQKNFQKFTQKDMDEPIYVDRFARRAKKVAGDKVTLVSGARKKELQKFLKQQMSNPEFMAMNERQAQRVLRSKFNGYSKSQAERLIRTESNGAGNYASQEAAREMFDGTVYKEWITAKDARVRDAHAAMEGVDGQVVKIDEQFWVGGEYLDHPSDLANSGKPENVINCRCQAVYYPEDTLVDLDSMVSQGTALAAEAVAAKGPKVYDTTNRKEIEKAFKDDLGIDADLTGMDPKIAQQYINTISQIKSDFPELQVDNVLSQKAYKQRIKAAIRVEVDKYFDGNESLVTRIYNHYLKHQDLYGDEGKKVQAFAQKSTVYRLQVGSRTLEIDISRTKGITHWSARNYDQIELSNFRQYDIGFYAGVDEGADYVIKHELGHILDYSLGDFAYKKEFEALISKYNFIDSWNYTALEADLSGYAAYYGKNFKDFRTMKREIIAEAIAEVYSMGEQARPLARSIYEAMKNYKKSADLPIIDKTEPMSIFIAPPTLHDPSDYF
jgi:hypothetical protein